MQAFSLDTPFGKSVLTQQIEGDVTDDGQISGGVVFTNSRGIFVEGDIEHPVELVFNTPVAAHPLGKALDIAVKTNEIVALLNGRGLTEDTAFSLHEANAF